MAIFTGAGVAIVTPFNEDGSINYDRLDELIEFHCAHKTDSIVICGTTGESATMTEEEHMQCVKFTIDRVNKRVPVIAGTGSNCTRTAIDMSKEASEYGADGLLLVTPYYNKATQNGLIGHFSAVAKEVKAPIIMYSVASRTGCNIEPATVARLVKDVDNIVGIKEASGNISQVAKIMNLTDGNVDLYSGNDDQIVPVLSLGGKGVISVLSNVAPDAAHDICEKYFEGDVKGSAELQLKALPLIDQLFCEVNPIPVKKAMQLMGIDCGPLRMPLTEISPEHEKNLAQAINLDGYIRKTTDLLSTTTIAAGQNFDNALLMNAGTLENKGFEVAITGRPIQTKDWFVELSVNAAYNKNEITELAGQLIDRAATINLDCFIS